MTIRESYNMCCSKIISPMDRPMLKHPRVYVIDERTSSVLKYFNPTSLRVPVVYIDIESTDRPVRSVVSDIEQ